MMKEAFWEQWFPRMVEWRRHLHMNPEVSFHEKETSRFVADRLRELGLEVKTDVGGHGVIGILRGDKRGKTIVLRADMDALPIEDGKSCEYKSRVPGVMHACGHDGHTSMLLGAAAYYSTYREELPGEIRFMFQPAEEVCPGGAIEMIKDGAIEGADVVYGLHLWTPLPVGTAASAPGPLMAAADEFFIDITGRGGHGGMPHVTADALVAGAALVMQLQTIVSRTVDPLQPAVVTIGTMQAGTAQNVIASSCRITGTVRTFDEATRTLIRERIEMMARTVSETYGTESSVRYLIGYPALVNDEQETARFFRTAPKVFGDEFVQLSPKLMPAEDFAYYLQELPGCFMFVGAGNPQKEAVYPHHHPMFDFDEEAMRYGVRLLVEMVSSCREEG
ncbi:M20 family metallopeptidase [Paenibacillus lactis]|uniref:Amidohydrolase n=2 Tax=Paenibacillus TaxID=44249 RepID=A0ABS4FIA2_9BACL|nr:amidohydrolase [Paenibacillus lactis]GIO90388.1 putative amidohydrolase YhaA [Paenibacillus lactis]